jgi:hypothetical protein
MTLNTDLSWSPREALSRALRGWWLVALGIILGAAGGLLAHGLRPAQYESGFGIQIGIDVTNTGELSQYELDVAFEIVGQILFKPAMHERVAAAARQGGIQIDAASLRNVSTVERKLGTWRVRVRANSRAEAERLAAIWLAFGVEELKTARLHALVADGIRRQELSLEECLARAASAEPSQGVCVPQNLKDLQAELVKAGALLAQERELSQGLSSGIVFGQFPAQPEAARPALYGRAEQAAAGGLIGLVLGVWAVQAGWVEKAARRMRG